MSKGNKREDKGPPSNQLFEYYVKIEDVKDLAIVYYWP